VKKVSHKKKKILNFLFIMIYLYLKMMNKVKKIPRIQKIQLITIVGIKNSDLRFLGGNSYGKKSSRLIKSIIYPRVHPIYSI